MDSKEVLNSNPEVLLRKRRNADRIRIEKQQLSKQRQDTNRKNQTKNKKRFVRIENIVSKTLATTREKERIKRVSKLELKKSKNEIDHLPSEKDYILKVSENSVENDNDDEEEEEEEEEEEDALVTEKIEYDGKSTLLFVIRIKGPNLVNLPHKVNKILTTLRLDEINTGVFIKLTKSVYPLLKLISPYVVIGQPSLSTIRSLIQKRSKIVYNGSEIILNDNNIVEEKLGESGIICIEDMIHEIKSMGESFQTVTHFLLPFKLNNEVSGFNALNKLKRLQARENDSKLKKLVSNSSIAPVIQVDIDNLIARLN
ncbi:hypothetical protein KAFR_0I02190 [Kazachstania africana CBS 2517]|uniref:Ribosome biogenesis protein RLP7 n=1 Tax=Kazachstania africana (strain ATCC 22294 / BCRC 22015 / CBS 2517 / CECT 1963 / NBRC 1671 / NRRL Y-8276) TaxID=1071382 RepID=H2B048_KAZAF|nr:hypothetical protein KAFR_0I02190 [Kazachstania africana CBS 2517]CCF59998.1 hypothetical protein KAFR_0I02190 [Kazachstania africana CBS 2517]